MMKPTQEDIAQRVNWVVTNTPFEKLTPEIWAKIQGGVIAVGDYHDEETLDKVARVIKEHIFNTHDIMDDQDITEIIGALQNAGILFRERDREA